MTRFTGTKKYNQSIWKRLPSLNPRGIIKDISLHFDIQPSDQNHIFVVGPPRSGTTLVRGIIAAHHGIATTDKETFFFTRRRTSLFRCEDVPNFRDILQKCSSKVEAFDKIASVVKDREGVDVFMEKTPEHALVLNSLLRWYPQSKIIFVVRDGRDAYSSTFRNPSFYNKVGDEFPRMWRDIVRRYLQNSSNACIKLVKYEELAEQPTRCVSDIMEFIGLPFEVRQLDPAAISETSMAKQKGHEMLSQRISTASVGTFRNRLSDAQIAYFERCAGPELRALGYDG